MAPKKKEQLKMSLGDFMNDRSFGGSWADEVEDDIISGTQALPVMESRGGNSYNSGYRGGDRGDRGYNSYGGDRGDRGGDGGQDRYAGYSRQSVPQDLPDKPPYTAHLGNLPYDITKEAIEEHFAPEVIINIRIPEDRDTQRPKGFAYAEFETREGLEKALLAEGSQLEGRNIRVRVAEPPREGQSSFSSGRDLDWTRRGPLADLPNSNNGPRREFNDRRPPREPTEDRGIDQLNNWERKGPLPPREDTHVPGGGEGRPPRQDSFRHGGRRDGAAWGEGRRDGEDGSRPPRPERVPTAAERDNQWRSHMRPESAAGDASPASPSTAAAPTGRRVLNLAKRTITSDAEVASPTTGLSKASPFGAARPIDTAARERAIEEKLAQLALEKKAAEEKAREDARIAKEAAEKAAAEKAEADAKAAAEKAEADAKAATAKAEADAAAAAAAAAAPSVPATPTTQTAHNTEGEVTPGGTRGGRRGGREPREPRETKPSRAAESGDWRSGPRGLPHNGPRRGDGARGRGGRGDGPRRNYRGDRDQGSVPSTPIAETSSEARAEKAEKAEKPKADDDGWTTVPSVPRGKRGRA